jgi:hypothetical protein
MFWAWPALFLPLPVFSPLKRRAVLVRRTGEGQILPRGEASRFLPMLAYPLL